MLSYLPAEPSWLTGPPEPRPGDKSGTCRICDTTHFNGRAEGFDTSRCSCGTAMCCSECDRCAECGDPVCPQCSVDVSKSSKSRVVCSGCHHVYLDDLEDLEADVDSAQKSGPPHLRDIVFTFLKGVRV